jgi:DNA-binding transcriptional LysR family regulator
MSIRLAIIGFGAITERTSLGVVATAAGVTAARGAKLLLAELGMLAEEILMCTPEMVPALHSPSLKYERLFDEELAVVAAPSHPLARRRRVRLADLAGERWILGVHPSLTRRSLEDAFLHQGFRPPRPILEATFLMNLFEAAASGIGIAACPLKGVENAMASGRIARLPLQPAITLPPVVIVYRRLLSEHPRLAALGEALRREFTR